MPRRDAWLAAFAAVLGISDEACRKDAAPQAREVASASPSASASTIVAATAPSASADPAPSAIASASAAPSASASVAKAVATANPFATTDPLQGICGVSSPGLQLNASCGASSIPTTIGSGGPGIGNQFNHHNSCGGGRPQIDPLQGQAQAQVLVNVASGAAGDDRIAASLKPRFRACANQALAIDPNQQGRLIVSVSIAPNGEVNAAAIESNTGLSTVSAQCMVRAVKNAQFPATAAARKIQILIAQTKSS